jgi:hypothetical protein
MIQLTLSFRSVILLHGSRASLHLRLGERGRSDGEDLDGLGRFNVSDDVSGVYESHRALLSIDRRGWI